MATRDELKSELMNQIDNCVETNRELTDQDIESLAGQLDTAEETVQNWVDTCDGVGEEQEDDGSDEGDEESEG